MYRHPGFEISRCNKVVKWAQTRKQRARERGDVPGQFWAVYIETAMENRANAVAMAAISTYRDTD
jgi:hypothetical protein